MQVMTHTCYTGRREAFVLAVLIEPPADQQIMGNVIVGAIRNMWRNQARMYGPQLSSSLHDKDGRASTASISTASAGMPGGGCGLTMP